MVNWAVGLERKKVMIIIKNDPKDLPDLHEGIITSIPGVGDCIYTGD